MAVEILSGRFKDGDHIILDVEAEEIIFKVENEIPKEILDDEKTEMLAEKN